VNEVLDRNVTVDDFAARFTTGPFDEILVPVRFATAMATLDLVGSRGGANFKTGDVQSVSLARLVLTVLNI
jgi:hypothetical protein